MGACKLTMELGLPGPSANLFPLGKSYFPTWARLRTLALIDILKSQSTLRMARQPLCCLPTGQHYKSWLCCDVGGFDAIINDTLPGGTRNIVRLNLGSTLSASTSICQDG